MKKLSSVRTLILAGSLLLQLNTLCSQSRGAAGDVDPSFDAGAAMNGSVVSLASQPDGKTLIGGTFTTVNGTNRNRIARLNANGSLDASFNSQLTTPPGSYDFTVACMVLQPDGKVLAGGYSAYSSGDPDTSDFSRFFLYRLNADGSRDASFEQLVGAEWDYYTTIAAMAVQPDGKILIGGEFSINTNLYWIARLNANGTLDDSFKGGANGPVDCIVLEPGGRILIGGQFSNRIARLNADGGLALGFNPGTGADGVIRSIALQPDGNLLIGGEFLTVNGVARPNVARLYGDSVIVPSLHIVRSNAFVVVSWPAIAASYSLQQSTNLPLENSWSPVAQPPATNAGQVFVTMPATGNKFFRLKSP